MVVRDALIRFAAATTRAQAEATKVAQRGGIEAARARAGERNYLGRKPSFGRGQLTAVLNALALGTPPSTIARETGVPRQTVYRINDDPTCAEAALTLWDRKTT